MEHLNTKNLEFSGKFISYKFISDMSEEFGL
jgi:hypothetical protein